MPMTRPRILSVDNPGSDRRLIGDALSHIQTDVELFSAETQDELSAALRGAAIDVVLTDLDVCGFHGLEVLAHVQLLCPGVPVIIVTANVAAETAVEAMKSGASDYIIKSPQSISRLPASIEAALCSRRIFQEKEDTLRSLHESEARLRHAVIHAPVPAMIHADDGEILAISTIWFELTGYTVGEISSTQEWTRLAMGEQASDSLSTIAKPRDVSTPLDVGEFVVRCADGSQRVWVFRSTPLGVLSDGRGCAISIASDVTEHRELEAMLRRSQKLEAVGRLAGGVAHDFNNMLQVILGYATLATKEFGPPAEVPPWLAMIMEAAGRSADLTRQLLAFTHLQPIELQTVKLEDAITGIVKLLSRIVEEEVELTSDVAPGTWNIEMDLSRFDSVVANLVINARDAIVGAGKIDVMARNRSIATDEIPDLSPGDYVMISVHDTGAGIAPRNIERVFEPFFTTKASGVGNGIGLSSVQGIVRESGGSVVVESTPDEGTTFSVFLPRYDTPPPSQHRERPRPVSSDAPRRVLLVEDEEEVLRITERLLLDLGFQVVATRNPEHALELVQQNVGPLDLVMTDVVMPGIDGPTLVERLRTLVPEVPVLFTSGYPADTLGEHGVWNERTHFLPKPFSRDKLEEKVEEVLQAGSTRDPSDAGDIE